MTNTDLSIHPGEILLEEFIKPYGLTASRLADRLGLPANRITAIVNGERSISSETAILLAEVFGTSEEFWINLQSHYDLGQAKRCLSLDRMSRATALHRDIAAMH